MSVPPLRHLLAVTTILMIAVTAVWALWPIHTTDVARRSGVTIVPAEPEIAQDTREQATFSDIDRVAQSERSAAIPPSGGPGPEDTRPRLIPGATRVVRDDAGVRLYGTAAAFNEAGFANGDILVSVDGRETAKFSEATDVVAMLIPGTSVEVIRHGSPLAWRIGGKAE